MKKNYMKLVAAFPTDPITPAEVKRILRRAKRAPVNDAAFFGLLELEQRECPEDPALRERVLCELERVHRTKPGSGAVYSAAVRDESTGTEGASRTDRRCLREVVGPRRTAGAAEWPGGCYT